MPASRREEILNVYKAYCAERDRCEKGEAPWSALAAFFTDDAVFTDPAWGRVEGIEAVRRFLDDSMAGLEGWTFPHLWTMVDDDRVVSAWMNRLPGSDDQGRPHEALGVSILEYAGDGKFRSETDVLNMVEVMEVVTASGWAPGPDVNAPPMPPRRR